MTMSLDAEKLFPSLLIEPTAKEVAKEVIESDISFEGIDYTTAARYVAANCGPIEIIQAGLHRVIPRRKFNKGAKPGVTTKELGNKERSVRQEKKTKARATLLFGPQAQKIAMSDVLHLFKCLA